MQGLTVPGTSYRSSSPSSNSCRAVIYPIIPAALPEKLLRLQVKTMKADHSLPSQRITPLPPQAHILWEAIIGELTFFGKLSQFGCFIFVAEVKP